MKKDEKLKREIKRYRFENGHEFERFKRKKEQTQLILLVSSIAIMTIAAFSGLMDYALDALIKYLSSYF